MPDMTIFDGSVIIQHVHFLIALSKLAIFKD